MDTSLALVPVQAFSPFSAKADGLLVNSGHSFARPDRKEGRGMLELDGSIRMYGKAGVEMVETVKGELVDLYV